MSAVVMRRQHFGGRGAAEPLPDGPAKAVRELESFFSAPFSLWDGAAGELVCPGRDQPLGDELAVAELVRAVARERRPQFIADAEVVVLLALPIVCGDERDWVATAAFVTRHFSHGDDTTAAAELLGLARAEAIQWVNRQTPWTPGALLQLGSAVAGKLSADAQAKRTANEVELISQNLANTYEEISLLYTITQNLRISSTDEELGRLAIARLVDCVPAESFAVQYLPVNEPSDSAYKARKQSTLITRGDCPVDNEQFTRLVEQLDLATAAGPFVGNRRVTGAESWEFPEIRQLIVAPLTDGEHIFGWFAAFNHVDDEDFGTVESNMLSSLGALLGIHCGNRELYRRQSELLANVVRALVSAIDAKDPYTSGHSDRVARFAVRIALEMRCNPKMLSTVYMAGLLHDVGKIGIDDSVLRKAGRLTAAEFEHIKMHPELGYKILADLKQLADVLPAVLHHHERWNGRGYPHGLQADEIPLIARIMSVADAYDAMTSDRPYRSGMPDDKVDDVFRHGAGGYWDPHVVDAYFKSKEDIEEISRRERANLDTFTNDWA